MAGLSSGLSKVRGPSSVIDPTETFNAMMQAYGYGLVDEAADRANNLADWLNKGGFAPTFHIATEPVTDIGFTFTETLAREFCRAACRLVLDQHEAGCDPSP